MRYKRDNSYHTKTTSESDDDECTTTGWNFNMDDLLDGHDDEENDMPVRTSPTKPFSVLMDRIQIQVDDVMYENTDGTPSPHVAWANGSCYDCKVCHKFSISDQSEFTKHIREHGIAGLTEYRSDYGDPFSDLKTIECRICNGWVIHDYATIYQHLKRNVYITRLLILE